MGPPKAASKKIKPSYDSKDLLAVANPMPQDGPYPDVTEDTSPQPRRKKTKRANKEVTEPKMAWPPSFIDPKIASNHPSTDQSEMP